MSRYRLALEMLSVDLPDVDVFLFPRGREANSRGTRSKRSGASDFHPSCLKLILSTDTLSGAGELLGVCAYMQVGNTRTSLDVCACINCKNSKKACALRLKVCSRPRGNLTVSAEVLPLFFLFSSSFNDLPWFGSLTVRTCVWEKGERSCHVRSPQIGRYATT